MSVYLLAKINIHDRKTYGKYESGFLEVFAKFNGSLLTVAEDPEVLEGSWPVTRTVLIEFPTKEEALQWYQSAEYQLLMQYRLYASSADVVLLGGLPS